MQTNTPKHVSLQMLAKYELRAMQRWSSNSILENRGVLTSTQYFEIEHTQNYPKKDTADGHHVFAIIGFSPFSRQWQYKGNKKKNQEQENIYKDSSVLWQKHEVYLLCLSWDNWNFVSTSVCSMIPKTIGNGKHILCTRKFERRSMTE